MASGKTPMNSSGFARTGERTEKGLVLDWCWLSSYGPFLFLSFPSPAMTFAQAQTSCLLVWGNLSYSDQNAAGLKCAVLAHQLWPGGGWEEQYTNLWTGKKHKTLVQKSTATKGAADYRDTVQAPIAAFFEKIKPHISTALCPTMPVSPISAPICITTRALKEEWQIV